MSKLAQMLDKYRKQKNVTLKVGIMGGKTYPEGELVSHVGFLNEYGTDTIPPRPFFRTAVKNNRQILPKMLASLLSKHEPVTALSLAGEHMAGELTSSVMTWTDPPNADSTVKQKGFDSPLRANDKLLRNSFSYEIER